MAEATIPSGEATDNPMGGEDRSLRRMHWPDIESAQIDIDVARKKLAYLFETGAQRFHPASWLSEDAVEGLLYMVEDIYRAAESAHASLHCGVYERGEGPPPSSNTPPKWPWTA